jgi:hypothetical protein
VQRDVVHAEVTVLRNYAKDGATNGKALAVVDPEATQHRRKVASHSNLTSRSRTGEDFRRAMRHSQGPPRPAPTGPQPAHMHRAV